MENIFKLSILSLGLLFGAQSYASEATPNSPTSDRLNENFYNLRKKLLEAKAMGNQEKISELQKQHDKTSLEIIAAQAQEEQE